MTKNFNNKVRNYIIRSASWIDTTADTSQSLLYQQTLFDICEIYVRRFRKLLRKNRKKLIRGTQITEELNQQCMADFAKRKLLFEEEIDSGNNKVMQKKWDIQIQKELTELNDFAFEK